MYHSINITCGLLLFSYAWVLVMAYLEDEMPINVELYHALDSTGNGKYAFRGNISITSFNSKDFKITQNQLTEQETHSIKNLAANSEFYHLRATVNYRNGEKQTFFTANKACQLLMTQLNDEFWISIDGSGYVNGITYMSTYSSLKDCYPDFTSDVNKFTTEVLVRHIEPAPVPDTANFIQKVERDRVAKERGETRDDRGFFAKYWMYIVPLVLLVFISGATNQEVAK